MMMIRIPTAFMEEWAKEHVKALVVGALEAARELLVEFTYSIALVGGGACILLWLGGWDKGKKWAGILLMVNVLIKFLLG
ncbi:hypothetical protein MUG84_00070 [Paenibacillus sp. KQZ6P-2]|uniref:Uncharacterized protein n=1 Tax=Paenibacillus mangrovi TaxID=2931978 RepID=A0A9X1WLN5_9BACL|nr:hypothetical protein [Paenibacillus mangrovi]MCJ8010135.1 hypothetical protein [Paenibacillus mangrovi]